MPTPSGDALCRFTFAGEDFVIFVGVNEVAALIGPEKVVGVVCAQQVVARAELLKPVPGATGTCASL
jgi:5,10-methylene-tetrahydrofolate dehydrogenase/methenyl tetrahydrofolate cyclohydrolase